MDDNELKTSRRGFVQLAAAAAAAASATALRSGHAHATGGRPARAHFVLVHGAWHGAWCYYKIIAGLERAGHRVTAIDLPSHGIDGTAPGTVTLNQYTDRVVGVLDASPDPVVLVGHSMGGIVISSAAEARPHKIDKLVYLSAFLLQSGQSLFDIASTDAGSLATPNLRPDFATNTIDVVRSEIRDIFYAHCDDSDVALARALLKVNPLAPVVTPLALTPGNFGRVRRFYISCLDDQAISEAAQRRMYTALPCEDVLRINTDHSPFFSEPHHLLRHLADIARR